ncbi:KCNB2, partial [Symbiodinium sp. CCMP2456]
ECTQPLRSLLALLIRCVGQDKITAQELLDLCGADVALAVAVIAEALIAPRPPGLPLWPLQLCSLL